MATDVLPQRMDTGVGPGRRSLTQRHTLFVRVTHWINVACVPSW